MENDGVFEQVLCRFGDQPAFHGTVTLTGDGLVFSRRLTLKYFNIEGIGCGNHTLSVGVDGGLVTLSELGYAFDEFTACLFGRYNDYLLRGYYTDEPLEYRCSGEYEADGREGEAEIRLYPSSLCVMPVDAMPIRFPLCFIRETDWGRCDACITDDEGRQIHIKRLGYEQDAFEMNLTKLRERQLSDTLSRLRRLWGETGLNLKAAAPLLLEGNCAPLSALEQACPGFTAMFDGFAACLPSREEYALLRELGGPAMAVGVLRNATADNPAIWMATPIAGGDKGCAAVEVMAAEQPDAATYLYHAPDFSQFLSLVSRAMEAVDYRREPIRAPDGGKDGFPADERLALALRLTPSLKILRERYAGRAIHRSLESWKHAILSCR